MDVDAVSSWLIDMDGVLVREDEAVEGAARWLAALRDRDAPHLVLTNNSIYTRRDLAARLAKSGLEVDEDRIWTSALATRGSCPSSGPAAARTCSARRG